MIDLPCTIYHSRDSYVTINLNLAQLMHIIEFNNEERKIFAAWFVETFPSDKGIPKAEEEINKLIWRFKFKFIHKYDDIYEFTIYRKRWFDKLWSRTKRLLNE